MVCLITGRDSRIDDKLWQCLVFSSMTWVNASKVGKRPSTLLKGIQIPNDCDITERSVCYRQMLNRKYRTENRLHSYQKRKQWLAYQKGQNHSTTLNTNLERSPYWKASTGLGNENSSVAWDKHEDLYFRVSPKLPCCLLLIFAKFLEHMFAFLCPVSYRHSFLPWSYLKIAVNYLFIINS